MRGQKLYRIKLHGKRRMTWLLAASLFRATLVHSQYRCTKNGPCSESELTADSLRCQSRTICHARRAIASARSWPHSILTRYTETFATMSSATVLPYQLGRNVREWNGSRTRLHGATAVVKIGRGLPPKCAAAVLEGQMPWRHGATDVDEGVGNDGEADPAVRGTCRPCGTSWAPSWRLRLRSHSLKRSR
jgi:hypothetical protein